MTSEEIQTNIDTGEYSYGRWLKEIAYQLAVMNEREANRALGWPIAAGQPWPNLFPIPSSNPNVGSL